MKKRVALVASSSTASTSTKKAKSSSSSGASVFSGLRVGAVEATVNSRRVRALFGNFENWKRRTTAATATTSATTSVNNSTPVIYWMSRDMRVEDNWALLRAAELAYSARAPLVVAFCLARSFPDATRRAYSFMLPGLQEVERRLRDCGVAFHLLQGEVGVVLPSLVKQLGSKTLVCDFSPLRLARVWRKSVVDALKDSVDGILIEEVDAHNIVPCWHASDKQEWAARTIRSKLVRALPEFLVEFPNIDSWCARLAVRSLASSSSTSTSTTSTTTATVATNCVPLKALDWLAVASWIQCDETIRPVDIVPGENAAHAALTRFCQVNHLKAYSDRNDPTKKSQSQLSAYLHFGHLAAQRAAINALALRSSAREPVDSFLEELIVRRELSDNYCYYQPNYDRFEGLAQWARDSLTAHAGDRREYVYTEAQWIAATTHDELWNAAQRELKNNGKMHGFMRMYWAKKILEWSASPQEAIRIALLLNDRYSIDGRDPNGFVGVLWSIGGLHDQGWMERPVFGKVRYMNRAGCDKKFDVPAYIAMN